MSRRLHRGRTARDALVGAVAGVGATTAMTLAADILFRRLPAHERYPLPPRELIDRTAGAARSDEQTGEPQLQAYTLAGHFGFGAAAGAFYGAVLDGRRSLGSPASGIGFGLMVWTASYLGWVPAIGLMPPATQHPLRRNALMISVHAVWGAVLWSITRALAAALAPIARSPHDS